MKIILAVLTLAFLVGCDQQPPTPHNYAPVIGIDGYHLGGVLPESLAPNRVKSGGYYYMNSLYTNCPPFTCLNISADDNRKIYSVWLMMNKEDVRYDTVRELKQSLSEKYGSHGQSPGKSVDDFYFGSSNRQVHLSVFKDGAVWLEYCDSDVGSAMFKKSEDTLKAVMGAFEKQTDND